MRKISLALQGGGSLGAFSWGVLDRLRKEPDLEIAAISGTSSGAINAAAFAYGSMQGGAEGAREALQALWHGISGASPPWSAFMARLAHSVSPYQYPFYTNALAGILEKVIDFEVLGECQSPHIYVCATNVKTNQRKVFSGRDLTLDALLASACLPQLFRAIEIDGESYWDGGYMGNPVLSPLLRHARDVLIVQVNSFTCEDVPTVARDIADRVNEIAFNASLMQEINTVDTITRMIERGELAGTHYKPIHFHNISAPLTGSKSDTGWQYLLELHNLGWNAADKWTRDPNGMVTVGTKAVHEVPGGMLSPLWSWTIALMAK